MRKAARRLRVGGSARGLGRKAGARLTAAQPAAQSVDPDLRTRPLVVAVEVAGVRCRRQPRLARTFPVPDRPVELALLRPAVGDRAAIRTQFSLIASGWSVPEPDIAVVPGSLRDYATKHPASALLVVEVSNTSLKQDRLSKSRIYAAANIPEYWIVNLRESVVEVMRDPDPASALYRDTRICTAGDALELVALPGARVAVAELLPARR